MKTERLKRIRSMIPLVGTMVLALSGMAHASLLQIACEYLPRLCKEGPIGHPYTAPEFDVGMAVSGVTMLAASLLVIVERRRRR